jgi:hypothetical protein
MIESDTDYREKYKENWKANNPGKDISKDLDPEEYKYMQVEANGKKETRKIQYDLEISVGAGLPNNKAYRYSVIRQAYVDKAISRLEYRNYLIKQLGVDIQEYPETMQEQQELGIVDEETMQEQQMIQQNPNIEGLTPAGNPQTSYMKGV